MSDKPKPAVQRPDMESLLRRWLADDEERHSTFSIKARCTLVNGHPCRTCATAAVLDRMDRQRKGEAVW